MVDRNMKETVGADFKTVSKKLLEGLKQVAIIIHYPDHGHRHGKFRRGQNALRRGLPFYQDRED